MFVTLFHSILLVFQLLISDNSSSYNHKLIEINKYLQKRDYKQSFKLLRDIEKKTFFNNHQLDNLLLLLSIKTGERYFIRGNNKILTSIKYFENGKKNISFSILQKEIAHKQSDTCIKWFEILNSKIKLTNNSTLELRTIQNNFKEFNKKDALDILNLMKNKEKYIQYE